MSRNKSLARYNQLRNGRNDMPRWLAKEIEKDKQRKVDPEEEWERYVNNVARKIANQNPTMSLAEAERRARSWVQKKRDQSQPQSSSEYH